MIEQAMAPAVETAFKIVQRAVAGRAALGIGALCFYGLGLSSETGTIDKAGYVLFKIIYCTDTAAHIILSTV